MKKGVGNNCYAFVGKLSSNLNGGELKCFKNYALNHFNSGGGIVCIYSESNDNESIDLLSEMWGVSLKLLVEEGKIVFMCREDYCKDSRIDIKEFIKGIEEKIDILNKNGCKHASVYMTIDSFWHLLTEEELKFAYDRMKTMSEEKKSGYIFRYIAKELSKNQIHYLLKNHENLLVDEDEDFKLYTRDELIYESLILKAEHSAVSENYKREMERVEHLRVLGELTENTIHDINNLLSTISGYAQLSLAVKAPREIESYLNIINKTALDGANVIERIRSHTKGSNNNRKSFYKINHILKDCVSMTKHKFKRCSTINNKLRLETDLNSKGYIYVNEYEIRQSILNIILNGVDAMDNGGVLTIKSYDIDDEAFVEIKDTGKGIDEETIHKIFDSYFTTKGIKGTGLGLNIARKVIKNYEGDISVDSKVGEGTKFTLKLPILKYDRLVADSQDNGYNII